MHQKKPESIPPETAEGRERICLNCHTPLVIRDEIWVCFTCAYEEKVEKSPQNKD